MDKWDEQKSIQFLMSMVYHDSEIMEPFEEWKKPFTKKYSNRYFMPGYNSKIPSPPFRPEDFGFKIINSSPNSWYLEKEDKGYILSRDSHPSRGPMKTFILTIDDEMLRSMGMAVMFYGWIETKEDAIILFTRLTKIVNHEEIQ